MEEVWASVPRDPNVLDAGTWIEWGDSVWTMQGFAGSAIVVYSLESGESRLIDREGEGPGEFKSIRGGFLDPSGDTLVVADMNRVSLLTAGGRFARSFTPPLPLRLVRPIQPTPNGDFVIVLPWAPEATSREVNRLHRIDRTGELLSSFAPGPADSRPRIHLGEDPATVWLLSEIAGGFRAELWKLKSESLERAIELRPEWWHDPDVTPEEVEQEARQGVANPQPSKPTSLRESDGILWVVVLHPAADPAPFDPSVYEPAGDFDSVILAMEIETGQILTGTVLTDQYAGGWTEGGRLRALEHDRAGHPGYRLYQISLERPAR